MKKAYEWIKTMSILGSLMVGSAFLFNKFSPATSVDYDAVSVNGNIQEIVKYSDESLRLGNIYDTEGDGVADYVKYSHVCGRPAMGYSVEAEVPEIKQELYKEVYKKSKFSE